MRIIIGNNNFPAAGYHPQQFKKPHFAFKEMYYYSVEPLVTWLGSYDHAVILPHSDPLHKI